MDETNTRRAHKITIVDVAKAAGVSHATVSRVLNNQGYIGEQTRLKVLDVVERLGYVANAPARSLAGCILRRRDGLSGCDARILGTKHPDNLRRLCKCGAGCGIHAVSDSVLLKGRVADGAEH